MNLNDIVRQYPTFFLEEDTDNQTLHLKRNHKHYTQVQDEMAVMGCKWCHLLFGQKVTYM
jgi:hypothetical protein